jgi:hypothetical protein
VNIIKRNINKYVIKVLLSLPLRIFVLCLWDFSQRLVIFVGTKLIFSTQEYVVILVKTAGEWAALKGKLRI